MTLFRRPDPVPGPDVHLGVLVPNELKRDWTGVQAMAWQHGVQAAQWQARANEGAQVVRTKPAVGDRVHYVSHGTPLRPDGSQAFTRECRAAIVTEVVPLEGDDAAQAYIENWDESQRCRVGLAVFNPTGMFFNTGLYQDEAHKAGGTWHWPERTEGDA